jgi:hypothetical protein
VASDPEEPNRVLGIPRGPAPYARQGEEQKYVAGLPVGWLGPVDRDLFRSLAHPIQGCKRWARRRHLGPYATEKDES